MDPFDQFPDNMNTDISSDSDGYKLSKFFWGGVIIGFIVVLVYMIFWESKIESDFYERVLKPKGIVIHSLTS